MGILCLALTGSGRLPEDLRASMSAEESLVLEEGLPGSFTYRKFRAPGQYAGLRKDAVSGAIAVTDRRLVVWAGRFKHVDVPHDHPLRDGIEIEADRPDRICFAYDAGAANPVRSGRVEVRLRTGRAAEVVDLLTRLSARG